MKSNLAKTILYWTILIILFFILIDIFNPLKYSVILTFVIFLPIIPPVHLNFFLFEKYFNKRKYFIYFLLSLISISLFGFINQWVANQYFTDGDFMGVLLNPLFAVILSSGIKGLLENIKIKYQVLEAKAKQTDSELKLTEIESKQVKAELDLLKMQVNPHFLFNTLNSIYSLALDNSPKTPQAVMLLSKLMRYQLESSKLPHVSLNKDIEFIRDYIELEKIRLADKCNVSFHYKEVDSNIIIPPLLLIPLVENCFKHGISINKEKNFIEIKLELDNNKLEFNTKNNIPHNGSKYFDDKISKTGIENLKKRLELLFKDKYSLSVKNINNTFETKLEIQL